MRAHIKERGPLFHQFDVLWTPTVLTLDPAGRERHRLEGYLPPQEFAVNLRLGLARVGFMRKEWAQAESIYDEIVQRFADARSTAEAIYWRGVCRYKRTNDGGALRQIIDDFAHSNHADSLWAAKAEAWRR